MALNVLQSKTALSDTRIRHGFFTREGGVSTGHYASLNCGLGSGDERSAVIENRKRAALMLGVAPQRLLTAYQIHSPHVALVCEPWIPERAPQADSLVTREPGIGLGILTADCAPVLLADRRAGVIGAAHAGWRGALGGVIEATVDAMTALGATRRAIEAVIGPCIGQSAYEVGADFRDLFLAADSAFRRFFLPAKRAGHAMFDLSGFVASRLEDAKVGAIDSMNLCTYADPQRFFSFRRATHQGEPDYGRNLAMIMCLP